MIAAPRTHGVDCRCSQCRHARFRPGPPSRSRKARAALLFYGHGRAHPKKQRVGGGDPRSMIGAAGYQVRGPIAFGPPDFIAGAHSRNRHLVAPAPTVRWVTPA